MNTQVDLMIDHGALLTVSIGYEPADPKPFDAGSEPLTYREWWDEWRANVCCPSADYAANVLCGCGGSGEIPSGVSRLLLVRCRDE